MFAMMWRAILGVCVFAALSPVASRACTCAQAPPGKCPGLQEGDVVFLGTVTQAVIVQAPGPAENSSAGSGANAGGSTATLVIRYRFHVDELFAGPHTSEIDVYSGGDDGDCGYRFKEGAQYLVYPQKEMDERLFVTHCSNTRPAADAVALLPQLRAMRKGEHVASVFGILRRADPPFLSPPGDPDDPLPNVSLQLRSQFDRFHTTTDSGGVYSFYDVHEGSYSFTANLPSRLELTQKTLAGGLPPFKIPDGACYEYNVDALPIGHIQGTVYAPDGKPLQIASLELYRAGEYAGDKPGLWAFQGAKGVFDFDHIGEGQYILVYNRLDRKDPDSPFPREFYPGVTDLNAAKTITLKDGEDLSNLKMKLVSGYSTHKLRVHLQWRDGRPPGTVTVEAKAEGGNNPESTKLADALWEFTLLDSENYTVSAYEVLRPVRAPRPARHSNKTKDMVVAAPDCTIPPRIQTSPVRVSGSDSSATDIVLIFSGPECVSQ
jgi:hypothetical protein